LIRENRYAAGDDNINRKSMLYNTIALTISSLLNRTIDMAYTVYMSNKMGSEGMGLHQLIMSVYILAATIVTSGIGMAVCMTLTEQIGKHGRGVTAAIMRQTIFLALILSVIAAAGLYISAPLVSKHIFKDARTILPLKILIASLFFMAVSSCLKGYFYAVRGFIQTIAAQLLEQLVKFGVFFLATALFVSPKNIEYACGAAALGISVSELSSCLCLLIFYLKEKPRSQGGKYIKLRNTAIKAASIALPLAIGSYIASLLKMLENAMLPQKLMQFGTSSADSLSELGLLKGMVMPVLFFPAAFLSSFCVALIPEVSEGSAKTGRLGADNIVSRVLQVAFIFSIFVAGIFLTLGKDIGMALYNSEKVGIMLKILAISAPCIYIEMISGAVLNGLGQQMSILKYNTFDGALNICLIYFFVPMYGINGFLASILATSIISFALFFLRLIKFAEFDIMVKSWIIKPIIAIAASGYTAYVLLRLINKDSVFNSVFGTAFIGAAYALWLIAIGAVSRQDINWFAEKLRTKASSQTKQMLN